MAALTTLTTHDVGVPPAPPEAHQRAGEGRNKRGQGIKPLEIILRDVGAVIESRRSNVLTNLLQDVLLVALVAAGTRAPLAAYLSSTTIARARMFFRAINGGKASPSGQFPSGLFSFFDRNPIHRAEATVFLRQWRAQADVATPAMRLLLAYREYLAERPVHQLAGEPLTFERCYLIASSWVLHNGRPALSNGVDFYPWAYCRICGKRHVSSRALDLCPWCRGSIDVSQRLRGRAGRRKGKTIC